ncbi:MAG TPA: hypothetical protein VK154_00920 [Chitinophagales bacterium]|nr:hypothetical protein [Chitinophagales bacterium]
MKCWLLIPLIALQVQAHCQQLARQQLRDMFLAATERKGALDTLARKLETIPSKNPTEESYYGLCNGLYCNYDDGNWAKMKHVIKAKNHLNSAVDRDPKDPELRFLRFMLEHFLPSFLGFNKHIPDDLAVVFANPGFIDDNPALKKKIMDFILWTKRCTPEQTKLVQRQLDELNRKVGPAMVKSN